MDSKIFKKLKLPDKSGVYFFLKNREIIYIGKATSLRDRVKSYLGKDLIETRGPILVDMISRADKIKWQTTDSVLEALILEAELIKKHQPKYNTKEKSDKSFNYVCITKPHLRHGVNGDGLPKVILVRGKNLEPKLYKKVFGPYPNGMQLREALKIVRKIFPFLDDKSKNYLEFYRQINLVPDLDDRKLYIQNIRNIILFFSGKKQQILKNLKKEMKEYAKRREFEKAGEIKRQIFALQHINDVALIRNSPIYPHPASPYVGGGAESGGGRIEAYDIAHMGGKNMVGVMVVVEDGEVEKSEYKKFKIRTQDNANDTGALKEVLERRFAHTEWTYPDLIVVDGSVAQINVVKKILANSKLNIPIVSVVKDEHHKARAIMGDKAFGLKYKKEILLANSEAHRFAIAYHKNMRNRNFLK
ncbi:MAG: Excinuclease ABC, C subunit domain protein [Parcubacteria group bacterium GW2011_GWF1_40_6]|uniref:Excinuclease ABC, C subunit domain protein n=2 Tax=Candidatus Nomuraibacteriota TaxID=1752729 RepID=A0A0G0QRZ2_9BACT|nr:MAG: Excinuclease ABC, C subunit domain protein [Candidatus Nomurabacteria bacterium GW2011_GWF2_40_12]KKR67241.1 MAG: Excinuclease ABC, C subunit domain protein [Parcubacteria group bacterium GW2011_GWF1_40_6]